MKLYLTPSPNNSWERFCMCLVRRFIHCFNILTTTFMVRKAECMINVYLKYASKLGWNPEMLGLPQKCLPKFTNLSDYVCIE